MELDTFVNNLCIHLTAWLPHSAFTRSVDGVGDPWEARALLGMLLIAPLCSFVGIQVVHFRLAFFSEAVGHSAFTGIGLGLLLTGMIGSAAAAPIELPVMIAFGVLVGLGITYYRRTTSLSSDTVIGVFSATIIALGLAIISASSVNQSKLNGYLLGNILTLQPVELVGLAGFFVLALAYQFFAYNRLMLLGLNGPLAQTMGVHVAAYEYSFAVLVSLMVMFSIRAVGILLVTSLLVIPAAAARNFAKSAGGLFWWGALISTTSAIAGLLVSFEYDTGTGSTTVLCTSAWFIASTIYAWWKQRRG